MSDTVTSGRCFVYVLPCAYEDLLKVGFSRDPLSRIATFHPRWFESFDLHRGVLVETETVRDARAIELQLHRRLELHNAPAPLTVDASVGGGTEWFRGASAELADAACTLRADGFTVFAPMQPWLRDALLTRRDLLFDWSQRVLDWLSDSADPLARDRALRTARDALDAFTALDIPIDDHLPDDLRSWYRG